MTLIDLEDLKERLTLEQVDITEFTDDDLELLLNNTITELIGYTKLPIQAVNHKTIIKDFKDDRLELDYYPVSEVTSLSIGSSTLSGDDYVLDEDLGILYFNSILSGLLVIEYESKVSDDIINNLVNPLLSDIIRYRISTNFTLDGARTSVKEGDVSVNFDSKSNFGNLIQSRIDNLKSYYRVRIKVL